MCLRISLLLLSCLLFSPAHAQGTLQVLFESGPRSERVNLVILSEGYTASQLDTNFRRDASGLTEALLQREPYATYRNLINAYAIAVPSNESGADYPADGTVRDTYFNATFGTDGRERLLTIRNSSLAYALLDTHIPEYDIPLVLVNDNHYGGSGGAIAVSSVEANASEIVIHEIAHSFAGLGDEYDYAGSTPRETPNTTQTTDRALIRWRHWIQPATPLPTPETAAYNSIVGLFEGAAYSPTGWYRPTLDSLMKNLGQPSYAVNEEATALSILELLPRLPRSSPAAASFTWNDGQPLHFTAEGLWPAGTADTPVQWYVDGQPVTGAVRYFPLITPGTAWKYFSAATAPAAGWNTASFTDTAWPSGNAPLGFGDANEATVIPGGPAGSRYSAHYFRKAFDVADTAAYSALRLTLRRDDGAVVYLNGTEIHRTNIATGAVSHARFAAASVDGTSENAWYDAVLPVTGLLPGSNLLAVEVHQNALNSSDLKFDLGLQGRGTSTAPPAAAPWIAAGAHWRYWDRGAPPAGWNGASFSDAVWSEGPAVLGYGNGGESTLLLYGGNTFDRYPASYFRRVFQVPVLDPGTRMRLRVKFDDGMVVYLNGTEVARASMGWGTPAYTDLAGREAPSDGTQFMAFEISGTALVPGRNVLAVEVHQSRVSSSDLAFDAELTPLPRQSYTLTAGALPEGLHTVTARYEDTTGKILQDPDNASIAERSWTITAAAGTDSDTDGLPDAWEMASFGSLSPDGTADPDGDGRDNFSELAAGTHPAQSASVFTVHDANRRPDDRCHITWASVPGRFYRVETSENPADPAWTTLYETFAAAAPATLTSAVLPAPAGPRVFFRVRTAAP